jgi:hypothetical protein
MPILIERFIFLSSFAHPELMRPMPPAGRGRQQFVEDSNSLCNSATICCRRAE